MKNLDNLEEKFKKVASKASLKDNNKATKNILIYNIPVEWSDILKENGISFSSYAKMAIMQKLKEDKLI